MLFKNLLMRRYKAQLRARWTRAEDMRTAIDVRLRHSCKIEERERCGNQMSGKSLGSALAGTISPVCPTHVSDLTVSRQLQSLFS